MASNTSTLQMSHDLLNVIQLIYMSIRFDSMIGPLCRSLGTVRVTRASARPGEADGKEGARNDSGEGVSSGGRAHQLYHATRE